MTENAQAEPREDSDILWPCTDMEPHDAFCSGGDSCAKRYIEVRADDYERLTRDLAERDEAIARLMDANGSLTRDLEAAQRYAHEREEEARQVAFDNENLRAELEAANAEIARLKALADVRLTAMEASDAELEAARQQITELERRLVIERRSQ